MLRLPLHRPRSRAFTLIELLVVIVILGILMAVAVPTFLKQQSKAQDSRTQQYLTTAYKAIRAGTPDNANQYPSSTSMVSWITQSEPELTAQRGSCTTGVTAAAQDAVLVDPSSTANSLTLCARSQSGNVWKLTATATSAPSLLDGTLVPLTFSGNEITDTTRAAATSGDGLTNDSSTGVFESSTNLLPNGGFETGTGFLSLLTGISANNQDTATAKFGSASAQAVASGGFNTAGTGPDFVAVTAGNTYTVSGWIRNDLAGMQDRIELWFYQADGTTSTGTFNGNYVTVPVGQWTYLTLTATAPANTAYGQLKMRWATIDSSNIPAGAVGEIDGLQLEAKSYPSPFINTTNAAATRNAGRVQGPASVLNSTQGWVAMRVRMGYSSASAPGTYNGYFAWGDGNQGNYTIQVLRTGNQMRMERGTSGVNNTSAFSSALTWNIGDYYTIIGTWTSTQVGISTNGSNFTTSANTYIPSIVNTIFDVGSGQNENNAIGWSDSDILWFATGTGTLSNADAATINGWGNTDPKRSSFPSAAQATMVWNGASTSGSLK